MGAAILCATACVRTGAGLTTVHVPKGQSLPLNAVIPEVMTKEYSFNKEDRFPLLSNYTSVAIGPVWALMKMQKRSCCILIEETKVP
jgi:NAD(P)H-hydrate epimerase